LLYPAHLTETGMAAHGHVAVNVPSTSKLLNSSLGGWCFTAFAAEGQKALC